MKNCDIVNDNISSDIKEKVILKNSSHNMLIEDKYMDEFNLIYIAIDQFIGRF